MSNYQKLFSPINIGTKKIKNRIVSSAHGEGLADHGLLNDHLIRYYERKAKGGTGLIIAFGSATVYYKAAPPNYVALWNPKNEESLKKIANCVHSHGSKIIAQATHKGRRGNSLDNGHPLQAPSAIPDGVNREIPYALEVGEIKEIIEAYAVAAQRLERCGFDGIEITSLGSHLIEQFWSPKVNKRKDEYGGDLNNRMRFSVEVIKAVAAAVSEDFIIAFRMSGDLLTDELGLNQETLLEIAKRLDNLGNIDLFDIAGGSGENLTTQAGSIPPDPYKIGLYLPLARKMKAHLSKPVLVAGRILHPEQAEKALQLGDCDLVAMTRAIIADPDLPNKAQAGETSLIRPCIGTNEGCIAKVYAGRPIACVVNPGIADDALNDYNKSEQRVNVTVVGGGPAGMEAARVSAERGHRVQLIERNSRLGGQILPAKEAPSRPNYGRHLLWLERELDRLGVEIKLGINATVDDILNSNPDEVVLATGARTIIPPEAVGVKIKCVTDVDILERKVITEPGSRILVYDVGGFRGAYVSNYMVNNGASQVELVSPLLTVCEDFDSTNKPAMYRELAKNGVICTPNQKLMNQTEGVLRLQDVWSGEERIIQNVDLIVIAGYRVSDNSLKEELLREKPDLKVHVAGDNIAPRLLRDAIAEGVRVGNMTGNKSLLKVNTRH